MNNDRFESLKGDINVIKILLNKYINELDELIEYPKTYSNDSKTYYYLSNKSKSLRYGLTCRSEMIALEKRIKGCL